MQARVPAYAEVCTHDFPYTLPATLTPEPLDKLNFLFRAKLGLQFPSVLALEKIKAKLINKSHSSYRKYYMVINCIYVSIYE